MAEPNAFFCVLNRDEGMQPSLEAVKRHEGAGALWLPPGIRFPQAVKSIQEYSQLPPNSEFAYLSEFVERWVKIRDVHAAKVLQPGVIYCFRVAPPVNAAAQPSKRRRREPSLLNRLPLHRIFDYPTYYSVQASAFRSFMAKHSTQVLSKQMVSSLAQIRCSADVEQRDKLCEDFKIRYHVSVHCGKEWWDVRPSAAAVLLESNSFYSLIRVKPGIEAYIQSGELPLNEENSCLKELALMHWLSQLLLIKPKVEVHEHLTLVQSGSKDAVKQVKVVEILKPSEPATNVVLRVSDGERELVMKVGHSLEAMQRMEHLCLQCTDLDQAVNEGKVLLKLRGCSSVPPLAFIGQWDGKPVVLTELQGSSLDKVLPCGFGLTSVAIEGLCKELSRIVIELHDRSIAHADISPTNIGVYTRPEEHEGRKYYLFDFGFAVELQQGSGVAVGLNPLFCSAETITSQVVNLVTELVSVAYVCLHLAGVQLPWQEFIEWGPRLACSPRDQFAKAFEDGTLELPKLTPASRDWFRFVLTRPRDTSVADIKLAANQILGLDEQDPSRVDCPLTRPDA